MVSWVVGVGEYGTHLASERTQLDGREMLSVGSVHDSRLDDIARRADSIFVISETLTHRDAVSIIERLATVDRSGTAGDYDVGCPVGFMHARTRAAMDAWQARQLSGAADTALNQPDVIVDSTLAAPPPETSPGLVVLPYQGVKVPDIRAIGPMRIFAVTAHGMSDHVYLDSDYICGRVRNPSPVPGGLNFLPSCMQEPYTCLFRPRGQALPAYEIEAQHLFVNSCGSAQFEQGEFGPDFSIWHSALEGSAQSYVGTLRWKDGHGFEAVLYRHLLNAGFPLGLAVAILNRVLPGRRIEGGSVYCLLGDPMDRVTSQEPVGGGPEITAPTSRIVLHGGYARCLIRDSALVSAWRAGRLLMHAAGHTDVQFSGVPSLGQPAVHVFAAGLADHTGEITVRVDDYQPLATRIADIRKTVSTCLNPALGIAGMYPNAVRQGGGENIGNRVLNISRLFRQSATDPSSIPRLFRSYQRLEHDFADMDRVTALDLLGRIKKSVFSISDHYRETFELTGVNSDHACPHCGIPAAQRVLRSLIDSSVMRMELVCPLCGIVKDVPDERLSVGLDSVSPVVPGRVFKASLTITNHGNTMIQGYCVAGITRSSEYCAQAPDSASGIEIPALGTRVAEFPFQFNQGVRTHLYTVKSALVVTGRIYICRRPVGIVVPESG